MSTVADTTSGPASKAAPPKLRRASTPARAASGALVAPDGPAAQRRHRLPAGQGRHHVLPEGRAASIPRPASSSQGGSAGLDNYKHWLLQQCGDVKCPPGTSVRQFYDALWVTLFFTVTTVVIEIVLGLWFAMIMNRTFKGRGLVGPRSSSRGRSRPRSPRSSGSSSSPSRASPTNSSACSGSHRCCGPATRGPPKFAIVIADVWKTTPFMALLILAGLQIIGADVYEAAKIDGASKWQTFTRITIPMIKVAAYGRGALPHPGRAAHLRPASHPHQRRRRQRTRDDVAVHPGHQTDPRRASTAPRRCRRSCSPSSPSLHSSSSSSEGLTWCNGHRRKRGKRSADGSRKAMPLTATPTSRQRHRQRRGREVVDMTTQPRTRPPLPEETPMGELRQPSTVGRTPGCTAASS